MQDLAMALVAPRQPLVALHRPVPDPGPGEVLLEVGACGVCRTDLHIADGDLPLPRSPLVPGHEIVGRVVSAGPAGATSDNDLPISTAPHSPAHTYTTSPSTAAPTASWTDAKVLPLVY